MMIKVDRSRGRSCAQIIRHALQHGHDLFLLADMFPTSRLVSPVLGAQPAVDASHEFQKQSVVLLIGVFRGNATRRDFMAVVFHVSTHSPEAPLTLVCNRDQAGRASIAVPGRSS